MGVTYNPRIITDGLVLAADAKNPKSVTSSTTVITNVAGGRNNFTGTGLNVIQDSAAGSVFSLESSNDYAADVSPVIPKHSFSVICWIKYQSGNASNYTPIWKLITDDNPSHNYYFIMDTRLPSVEYIHAYVKDYTTASWASTNILSQGEWEGSTTWFCIGLTMAQSSEYKTYLNGKLEATVSAGGRDFSSYGDIDRVEIGSTYGTVGARLGHFAVYNKPLSEAEIKQNFEALRGRFGL